MTYLLKYALTTLDELHEEHLAPVGVTPRELAVLLLLSDREPESQQQAAQRLGVDRTTMVGLLDSLQSKELVVRRADATDRRRNVVELTAAGQAALGEATHASDEAERRLLADLDEADSTNLRDLLTKIATGERAEPTS